MNHRRTLTALAAAASLTLGLGACGDNSDSDSSSGSSGDDSSAAGTVVTIKTFAFDPNPITVDAGTTITFDNQDDILHTITSGTREKPTGEFDEDLKELGSTAEITFDKPGTIDYFCDIHQGMDGQVVVK